MLEKENGNVFEQLDLHFVLGDVCVTACAKTMFLCKSWNCSLLQKFSAVKKFFIPAARQQQIDFTPSN